MLALEPVDVGPVTLRNRVATSGHTTNMGDGDGFPSQSLIEYHRARARGGVGLIISSGVRVRPESDIPRKLSASRDACTAPFSALAEAIRSEGARFFVQLSETGRVHGTDRYAPIGPSAVPWRRFAPIPHALTVPEIKAIVGHFGAAAGRMRRAGVDGIEVQFGHGTLLQQFLSPVSNRRTDEFGASDSGRSRFARMVLEAVREEISDDMAIGVRISASEFISGGLGPDEMLEFVQNIRDSGPLDFLNVSHSAYTDEGDSLTTQSADMHYEPAPFRHLPALFKANFADLQIVAACAIGDLELAEEMLQAEVADIVALTRAHIADPDIIRKHIDGNHRAVRHCIRCNQGCLGNLERGVVISCTVNPSVGREGEGDRYRVLTERLADANRSRSTGTSGQAIIVGAGPAGLEAAIEYRLRGYSVRVIERASEPGGLLRVVSSLAGREMWATVFQDQYRIASDLGVDFTFGTAATAAALMDHAPDVVVIATGSREEEASIPGVDHVHSVEEMLSYLPSRSPNDGGVVVVDHHGGWPAASVAQHLAAHDVPVCIVSEEDVFAPGITLYSKFGLMKRLRDHEVSVHLLRRVVCVTQEGVELEDVLSNSRTVVSGFNSVVLVAPRSAAGELGDELLQHGFSGHVITIGDAYAPRSVVEAIAEGRAAPDRMTKQLRITSEVRAT